MPGCPIVRITKHKDSRSICGAMGHHLRTIPTANADPARTPDNLVLVGPDRPREVAKLAMDRTKPLVKRKDANRAVELFLGASDDYWESPGASWMDLAESFRTWMEGEFGAANIIGFGVHLDESKPHFWALITPITPEGKLASSHWFDGPAKLSKMQDRLAKHMAPLGMVRGRKGVKATHIEVSTWHQAQAGNKASQKRLQREMAKREADALDRAQKAAREAVEASQRVQEAERMEQAALTRVAEAEEHASTILEKAHQQVAEILSRAKAEAVKIVQEARRIFDRARGKEDALRLESERLRDLAASMDPIEEERAARKLADIEDARKREAGAKAKPVEGGVRRRAARANHPSP